MDQQGLSAALATAVPTELADNLAEQFIAIRRDVATRTLGRASPGKFVETVVQVLQAIENGGTYDSPPNVDAYLRGLESRSSTLPDGLRICASRVARAMYALRSKRSIVHKAEINPVLYDLRLLYASAQWVLAELLALTSGISGEDAARLVVEVQLPVGELVETLGDRKIVQGDMSVREEALVLLMTYYPTPIKTSDVIRSMDRRAESSVRNAITGLWKDKALHREAGGLVVLTERGLRMAIEVAEEHGA